MYWISLNQTLRAAERLRLSEPRGVGYLEKNLE